MGNGKNEPATPGSSDGNVDGPKERKYRVPRLGGTKKTGLKP